MPAPANANADEHAAGSASSAHHERDQPDDHHRHEERGRVDARRGAAPTAARRARRRRTRAASPASASKVCAYLNLKKKLNVVSSTAPFIAAAAMSPGATNSSYGDRLHRRARHLAHEPAHADADRQQVQQRLDEPGEEQPATCRRYASVLRSTTAAARRSARPAARTTSADGAPRRAIAEHHCVSVRANVRTPHQHPARDEHDQERRRARPPSPPMATSRSSRRGTARPRATAARATPPARSQSGSWLTGKNVPENRNSGNTPMRMMTANGRSLSCVTANAVERGREQRRAEHRGRDREHAPRRRHAAEDGGDDQEHRRRQQRRAGRSTMTCPTKTSPALDRRRHRGVVRAHPLHARRAPATATRPPPASWRSPPSGPGVTNTR